MSSICFITNSLHKFEKESRVFLNGDNILRFCFDCCFRQSNPEITEWMTKMGYGKNYYLLEQYYEQK